MWMLLSQVPHCCIPCTVFMGTVFPDGYRFLAAKEPFHKAKNIHEWFEGLKNQLEAPPHNSQDLRDLGFWCLLPNNRLRDRMPWWVMVVLVRKKRGPTHN
ncbi:hypothetical protein ATANTOWER_020792 [Ataeniobius toweri]|uniref:Uncharacterized protein n=1 Tax=Ataeniobius toweri TaxID=208326 RepID=A0ABU7CL01_9TELE|nr:hypothetical protein [Ataeniobius toweri]